MKGRLLFSFASVCQRKSLFVSEKALTAFFLEEYSETKNETGYKRMAITVILFFLASV